MANRQSLPSTSSPLVLHLSDRALTPIVSSSRSSSTNHQSRESRTQAQALSSLTSTAITAYDTASRLGLGVPLRIMIETTSGPLILHSFLNPQSTHRQRSQRVHSDDGRGIVEQTRDDLRPLSGTTDTGSIGEGRDKSEALVNGIAHENNVPTEDDENDESTIRPAPLLIASVVAPSAADAGEARRAAARLERTGREFQREWIREQEESHEIIPDGEDG